MPIENNRTTPLVSIIMPVYNGSKWLGISIPSVLAQTLRDFELIVLNDGSTDSSLQMLEKFASQDHRMRVINQQNMGPGATLNKGISLARGEYLCFIDQDDSYLPTYLEQMVTKIEATDSEVVLCYYKWLDVETGKYRFYKKYYPQENCIPIKTDEEKKKLYFVFISQWQKILRRKFVIENKIVFSESKNKAHDLPFHLLTIFFASRVTLVPRELYVHRFHRGQITYAESPIRSYIDTFHDLKVWTKSYMTNDCSFMHFALYLIDSPLSRGLHKELSTKERRWIAAQVRYYTWKDKIRYYIFHVKEKENKRIFYFLFFHFSVRKCIKSESAPLALLPIPIDNVGRYSYCCEGIRVANPKGTIIGNFVSIGMNCHIGHGEHPLHFLSTSPYFYYDELGFKMKEAPAHPEYWDYEPVCIEHDVWIGDDVSIKNGVTIGTGAVIGACSMVTHDVPPYAIVVGNPARILRYRFDEDTRKKLLESEWWNLPENDIRRLQYDSGRTFGVDFTKTEP